MEWKCRNYISHSKALIDFSGTEPKIIGCLECDWREVRGDADGWNREERCVVALASRPGRCDNLAVIGGHCWRHRQGTLSDQTLYQHFRAWPEDLPQLYRLLLEQALRTAGIAYSDRDLVEQMIARGNEIRVTPERGASLVYFVEREGLIKIGTTTNLANRLKSISKGSSMPAGMTVGPVELLATEPGGRAVEGRLHGRFRKTRIHGTEWFRPSKALRNYIDDLARFQKNPDHFLRRVSVA
ncbi:GIY-YIG nuclease family protein [Streptosporangium vulgare]|uniref:GIY-YIG nuclease family protein n=1 Tax=Streptosporangium vulgare TaxID=46190 RepID=A0ABV5TS40_9ACTN